MSVIVTGVHFPTGCSKCKFNHDAICILIESCNYDETNGIARRPDCPLRPLPEKHGRLIDADALESDVFDEWMKNEISNGDWIQFREWLKTQKTIVEAEGEE